ncbi:MAG: FtsK/SpoIIIE family DNA translocase [Planctomycetota bacterium]|jgi:S-DNA-T family DNA segregation ATPase FtsK/SpoIIIE
MARKAVRVRREVDHVPPPILARRVGWVALAGLWVFLVVALASFDSSDWPSHAVAVHAEPTRNLCGPVGALVAYWSYHVIGIGAWVILAGMGAYLGLAAAGRPIGHMPVRAAGLGLMAVAVSGFHGLLAPEAGALAGAPAGLVALVIVSELGRRFSDVGTFLVVSAGFAVGAVVAVDRLVLVLPALLGGLWSRVSRLAGRLGALRARPRTALAGVGEVEADEAEADEDEYEDEYEYVDEDEGEYEDEEEEEECEDEDEDEPRRKLGPAELKAKLAKLPVRISSKSREVARDEDIRREESFEGYEFPSLDLLEDPETNYSSKMEGVVRRQAEQLESALATYGIGGEVVAIESGPVVTLYSVQLEPGTKVAKVTAVSSDVARALRAQNIRIVPNMVGKTSVGIEVPNLYKERVRLKELMSSGQAEGMLLPMFLGKDAAGEPLVADLTRMPHMLIAGTTGSGKSVCMNTVIMSWLYMKRPDELKLILVDPKMVELSQFQDIPHLMCPVVTETSKAAAILEWAVRRMEERYELLREASVRNVTAYNRLEEDELYDRFGATSETERATIPKKMPLIVFIIDELADLIMQHGDVERLIVRIAQKARAVGIHLMFATQRPQANVVTGLIKSNMPCRVSFKVASGMDSRIVLDHKGAELLLGQGDMLFMTPHTSELRRAQGTLVTDQEIRRVTKFLRGVAAPTFEPTLLTIRPEAGGEGGADPAERDPLFDEAVQVMIESGRGSVSLLQRRLGVGYSRASRLVDQMGLAGILGDHKGSVAREVLITLEEWEQMKAMEEAAEASGTMFGDEAEDDEDDEEIEAPLVETTGEGVPVEPAEEDR